MNNNILSRIIAPAVLAAVLGLAALAPGKAHASDDLVRVLVNVADVIYHGGHPYYRHGNYGRYDRVVIVRDRYHHPSYYRYVPRHHQVVYRPAPPRHVVYRPAPPRHVIYRTAPPRHVVYRQAPHYGYARDYRASQRHDRYDRYDRRHDRRDYRHDRRHDRRDDRRDRRDGRGR